jgi:hypothetical protein
MTVRSGSCCAIATAAGHSAHYIDAPLQYDDTAATSYTSDMVQHILSVSQEFKPDWVVMVLQGRDSSRTIQVAIQIHEQTSDTKFYFTSGYPHSEELNYARSCGVSLHFEFMPNNPKGFIDIIEQG